MLVPLLVPLLVLLLLPTLPSIARAAELHPAEAAGDEALTDLAAGRPQAALRRLRRLLSQAEDDDSRNALRCMLGAAHRRAGDEAGAVATLAEVPLNASCGPRAAFDRADALVALGRTAQAAALYQTAGADRLGDGRDAASADNLQRLAHKVLDDPDQDDGHAQALLAMALELRLPLDQRVALAEELGGLVLTALRGGATADRNAGVRAGGVLLTRLLATDPLSPEDDARLRRLAARLLGDEGLLAPLPDDAATLLARADVALNSNPIRGALLLARAAAAAPDDRKLQARLARVQTAGGLLSDARPHWQQLAEGSDTLAAEALLALARLEQRADPAGPLGEELLAQWLERFPTGADRNAVEALLADSRLDAARRVLATDPVAAVVRYDAFVRAHPTHWAIGRAAWEAGLAARAAGDRVDARRRWEELRVREPDSEDAQRAVASLAQLQAIDEGQLDAAQAWLRGLVDEGGPQASTAATQLALLSEESLAIEVQGRLDPRSPTVHVFARNLSEVQVRLHRVDPEAYLRAGGRPEGLPDLDVGVIAPDREWTATVPAAAPGQPVAFDLPLRVPGPGLYAVTVATAKREARAIALVGDTTLLARARGADLVVGTLRSGSGGDRPASGVRIMVAHGGTVSQARTGGDGLARLPVEEGSAVILADGPGGPALLALDWGPADTTQATEVDLELDRPVYLPGDAVAFRLVGRRGDAPLAGTWKLWLEGDGVAHPAVEIRADDRGSVVGELPLPAWELGGSWQLQGLAPGEDIPRLLASVPVEAQGAPARQVEVHQDGTTGEVRVREADGRPAVDVPVRLSLGSGRDDELARTDAAGRIAVAGPSEGVPWALSASLPGVGGWTRATGKDAAGEDAAGEDAAGEDAAGEDAAVEPLRASIDQDRPAVDQPVRLRLHGAGPVVVAVYRVLSTPEPTAVPVDPWTPDLDLALAGPDAWSGEAPIAASPAGLETTATTPLDLDGDRELDLGLLAAGRWLVRVVPLNPAQPTLQLPLHVAAPGPRLGALPPTLAAGTRADLAVSGPALVTAEGDGIEAAALVARSGRLSLDVPWQDRSLSIVATGALGQEVHARRVQVEAALDVALSVEEHDGRWQVAATVTGPDGKPVQAQVSLSAVDLRLLGQHSPALLDASTLHPAPSWSAAGGSAADLRHAAWAQAISAALLAETARVAEAQRAASAGQGRFSTGMLDEVMAEDTMLFGGLGTRGSGSGGSGSGYGSGAGGLGSRSSFGSGPVRALATHAVRDRILWQVVETDAQGRAVVSLDRPPPATFRLRATALTADALGSATVDHDAAARPFLTVAGLSPGGVADLAEPVVHVVNGSSAPFSGELKIGERREARTLALALAPGEASTEALGELLAGEVLTVTLDGEAHTLAFPVAIGATAPDGRLLRVAVGPGGGLPISALAAEPDPLATTDVGRAARAGRAALIGAAVLRGDARDRLLDLARRQVAAVRGRTAATAVDQAEVLALLFESDLALPELHVPRGELDQAAASLDRRCRDSRDRVAQVWALALTGRTIDESRLGRLLRDRSALDDETRSWLARGILALGREGAAELVAGDGPHAAAARRSLGLPVVPTAPPPVGDPDRAHWLSGHATPAGRVRGTSHNTARVLVDGVVIGTLDLAAGGELRSVLPEGATVTVEGAPAALVQRSTAQTGEVAARAARAPVGVDGRPVTTDLPLDPDCGDTADPCLLAVGDLLQIDAGPTPATIVPGGLSWDGGLRAEQPGSYVVTGLSVTVDGETRASAPLHVQVQTALDAPADTPADTPADRSLSQAAALALAEQAAAAEEDPLPLLAPWPGFDDWRDDLRPRALRLRFDAAAAGGDADSLVPAFEALRDGAPSASLDLPDVAAVARAYATIGRPDRAVDIWRAGLGAAFLAEAGPARRIEDIAGRLVSLKAMRQLTLRYPGVAVVDEAEFHLPERLAALIEEGIPQQLAEDGITATDVRLLAASWDREFLALHPDSDLAPQAGFHLVQGLLRLRAFQAAAEWADRVADASPEAPVLDGLRYVEGLARSELGQDAAARTVLQKLATGQWPQEDGSLGPAGMRPDARYALGRLAEARGDLDGARAEYEEVRGDFPEAERALQALSRVALAPEPLVVLEAGQAAALPVTVANVDTVHLRAYRLDLRTVFLRDGGLDSAAEIEVSGVSPAWSGQRDVRDAPFPRIDDLALPLSGVGAWLVQLDAEGVEATALVVRSGLALSSEDGPGGRRLVVRRGAKPAVGAEVRALDSSGQVVATKTDLRGVAMVPAGARALVFVGEEVAFTDPLEMPAPDQWYDYQDSGVQGDLMQNLDLRIQRQRRMNEAEYQEQYAPSKAAAVEASML